jgi:hypothetical protein
MTVPEIDDATREELFKQVRETQERLRSERAAVAAQPKGLLQAAAAEGPYVCPGDVDFKGIISVKVEGWLLYPPETNWGKVKYHGTLYGAAAVHGFAKPLLIMAVGRDELLGDVSCEMNVGGVLAGVVNLNFWRGSKFFGSGGGGGIIEGIGIFGGTLKFERM